MTGAQKEEGHLTTETQMCREESRGKAEGEVGVVKLQAKDC